VRIVFDRCGEPGERVEPACSRRARDQGVSATARPDCAPRRRRHAAAALV